jgi:hypothetical protein
MANERTVPLLPCVDIDEHAEFYRMLGFERTYRQVRPNPYVVMQREDLELHFFGLPDFGPEQSYGSCLVFVPDISAVYEAFAASMRATHGKLLVSGFPRMTRPRRRKNTGSLSGFSVIDPAGNWIRFFEHEATEEPEPEAEPASRVGQALQNAVVLGDSKGDDRQAARILDSTLAKHADSAPVVERVPALVYRAELAVRMGDLPTARTLLNGVREVSLTDDELERLADTLANANDLEQAALRSTEVSGSDRSSSA